MIDLVLVGNKISALRREKNLSQDDLAARLYVSRQAVSAWEVGKSAPSIDNVVELSKIFAVPFEEILCLEEKLALDKNDIFKGHDRAYVLRCIIEGKAQVDLPAALYQCTGSERLRLIRAVKEGKIPCKTSLLLPELTPEERECLEKGGR
jgi:transcriptional regulator with XRE-family HTH domain